MLRRMLYASVLLALILPVPATAQTAVGRVIDQATSAPLEGAFLLLLDEGGERRAGALTGPDGRFAVRAPAAGRYRIRVERIGWETFETDTFALEGDTTEVDVAMPARPIPLDAIAVEVEPRCGPPAGEATATLWEEARKALAVAAWAEETYLEYQVLTFDRTVGADGMVEEHAESVGWGRGREAFRSVSVDSLASGGYVQRIGEGEVYFGPDAKVLLSDTFLETHCFRAVRSGLRTGLAFEPVPERELPDVEGTLWFAPGGPALEQLEFRYTGLPEDATHPRIGGEVRFERVPGGAWIIREWVIRTPRVTTFWGSTRRFETEVDGIYETGGRIVDWRAVGGT